ncbi:MAG: ARMT1-like domain-containing protein, partial [Candidatus Poribacteria bacterium]|nr:ARMT1-like domain-containing protein [Candidatus Poribacteria bacterium]
RAAVEAPFAIDCYETFRAKVIDGEPQEILWLADNDGEVIFDLAFVQDLVGCGHCITIVGKAADASNDVTLADLHEMVNYPQFAELQAAIQRGAVRLMSSGAKTIGTNLYHGTAEFFNALLQADLVISKGQGNFFTTPGWKKDTFYLLLSKGVTAEQSTGVVADRSLPIDGLILAYLPSGTARIATLRELCSRNDF